MNDNKERRPLKVILVGSSGVGKTSLINAYFGQPHENDTQPTVAPAYCGSTVELKDKSTVDLQIWDTAGQEKFQSIGSMFYRESDIAFICFDYQNKPTIHTWISRVHAQVSDCIIFLVLTKSDLLTPDEEKEILNQKNDLLNDMKAQEFFITSASNKIGVSELFYAAAQCITTICKTSEPSSVAIQTRNNQNKGCC